MLHETLPYQHYLFQFWAVEQIKVFRLDKKKS